MQLVFLYANEVAQATLTVEPRRPHSTEDSEWSVLLDAVAMKMEAEAMEAAQQEEQRESEAESYTEDADDNEDAQSNFRQASLEQRALLELMSRLRADLEFRIGRSTSVYSIFVAISHGKGILTKSMLVVVLSPIRWTDRIIFLRSV